MKRGFTLVELLCVLGILMTLAAVLMPVLSQSKEAAKRTECFSNVRQLTDAMIMYRNDNDDFYPLRINGTDNEDIDQWIDMINPYVGAGKNGKTSPLSKCSAFVPAPGLADGYGRKKITGWGYGMNGHLHNSGKPVSDSIVTSPSEIALIGDSTLGDFYARPRRRSRLAYANSSILSPYDLPCDQVRTRHGRTSAVQTGAGGSTLSYTDGHVKYLYAEQIMRRLGIEPASPAPSDRNFYEETREEYCIGSDFLGG